MNEEEFDQECFLLWYEANYKQETATRLNDDPEFRAEREQLRQASIDAKNMRVLPVFVAYGLAREYRHLNTCDRKR